MTRLFKQFDTFDLESDLSFDKVIERLKEKIWIDDKTYNSVYQPKVPKRYFGIFSYPNKFKIKSTLNFFTWGLNKGVIIDIDIEKGDKTKLKFRVNNKWVKFSIFMIFLLFFGLLTILTIKYWNADLIYQRLKLFLFPVVLLLIGLLFLEISLRLKIEYFKSILEK